MSDDVATPTQYRSISKFNGFLNTETSFKKLNLSVCPSVRPANRVVSVVNILSLAIKKVSFKNLQNILKMA